MKLIMDFAYPSLWGVKLFFDKYIENELCLWVVFSGCWDNQNFPKLVQWTFINPAFNGLRNA